VRRDTWRGAHGLSAHRDRDRSASGALWKSNDRMLSALHTISTYPFELEDPIFAHYPMMKFGHTQSVSYFAELLVPMALQQIARVPEEDQGWVLTSSPTQGLPNGANLVCRAICDLLAKALPDRQAPCLGSMAIQGPRLTPRKPADMKLHNDYSRYDLMQRRQFHSALDDAAIYDLANFTGRHVVFVNDINVTGTQLASVTKLLRNAGVKSLNVLLIVNVDCNIGCAFPDLEYEINTSRISDLAEFTSFLRDCEFEPTAKLISRLMSHDPPEFAAIFAALGSPKRQLLHRAILHEGLYTGQMFREKLEVVERAVFGG
jgi:orotate phosphoribosyltransferase